MKTIFVGQQGMLPPDIGSRLITAIQNEIDLGCQNFVMDEQSLFVRVALLACRDLRRTNPNVQIEIVDTVLRQAVDECDTLICYVRPASTISGAYLAMQSAVQHGKKIVNLYTPQDDVQIKQSKRGSLFMQKVFN